MDFFFRCNTGYFHLHYGIVSLFSPAWISAPLTLSRLNLKDENQFKNYVLCLLMKGYLKRKQTLY